MESSPKISAVICALNEARSIGPIIEGCLKHVHEVVVMDGHSQDDTAAIARRLGAKVVQDDGKGKGSAIRGSLNQVTGDIVVFIDADGSHDPQDIPRLLRPILDGEADHVSGSRLLGGSSELHGGFDEWMRLMGSGFITACINRRFGVTLSESQNGFRAAKTSMLKALDLRENITTIEQEMIIKTLHAGYRMAEVPSHEHRRLYGDSHIKVWKVSFRYVYTLFKYLLAPRAPQSSSTEPLQPAAV